MFGWLFKRKEPKCRHYKDAGQKLTNMETIYRFSPYKTDNIGYSIAECRNCHVRAFGCVGLHMMSDRQSAVIDLYINHHIGPYDFENFLKKTMAWFERIAQPAEPAKVCGTCGGGGYYPDESEYNSSTGKYDRIECGDCNGTGRV